jgi:hypothetical protein
MNEYGPIFPNLASAMDQQLPEGTSLVPSQQIPRGMVFHTSPFYVPVGGQGSLRGEWWSAPPNTRDALTGAVWAATRVFAAAQGRDRRWNMTVVAMKEEIHSLVRQVTELKHEIMRLQNSRSYVVPLTTLSPAFHMMQQIPVTIEGDGESFTATFIEANVSASGETEGDAIANFKDSLMSSYEMLEGMPASQLGTLPARQWEILQNVVHRTDD